MRELKDIDDEKYYSLTNMFKIQMENSKSKITILISQILFGFILIVPIMQLQDIDEANLLKTIVYSICVIHIVLSIAAIGVIIALLLKKNVDILVNISAVLVIINICMYFYLAYITNIVHESYNNIYVVIAIISIIILVLNGVNYYKKAKKKLINGEYRKGNFEYKFNKKLLYFIIPGIPMIIPLDNNVAITENVFVEACALLGMNYFISLLSLVFSYFVINRIFFIYQLIFNKGEENWDKD